MAFKYEIVLSRRLTFRLETIAVTPLGSTGSHHLQSALKDEPVVAVPSTEPLRGFLSLEGDRAERKHAMQRCNLMSAADRRGRFELKIMMQVIDALTDRPKMVTAPEPRRTEIRSSRYEVSSLGLAFDGSARLGLPALRQGKSTARNKMRRRGFTKTGKRRSPQQ